MFYLTKCILEKVTGNNNVHMHFYTKNTTLLVTGLFWGISKALVEHEVQNSEYKKADNTV